MARKPNYGQNRAEVNRSKQAKKDEKLREREEAVARRKSEPVQPSDAPSPDKDPARD